MIMHFQRAIIFILFNYISYIESKYNKESRDILVINKSTNRSIRVWWININDGSLVDQFPELVANGGESSVSSFVGHSFLIKEIPEVNCDPNKDSEQIINENDELQVKFTVNMEEDQVIEVYDGLQINHTDSKSNARSKANAIISQCSSKESMEDFLTCIQNGSAEKIYEDTYYDLTFQSNLNEKLYKQVLHYTCNSEPPRKQEESDTDEDDEEDDVEEWEYEIEDEEYVTYNVTNLWRHSKSKIEKIDDFVTEDECQVMKQFKGEIPNNLDSISELINRMHDYAAEKLDLSLQPREPLVRHSIQTTPFCDGECTGAPFTSGDRVASLVLYCHVPSKYSLNFIKSQVRIQPDQYNGIFYSYVSGDTFETDFGFMEFVECPDDKEEVIAFKYSFRYDYEESP